jgi:hypothetical protein
MMETPERAFSTPEILGRVNAVWLRGRRFRERFAPVPPDREATIGACERAAERAPATLRASDLG